ncbi:MAG: VanZ family protein [Salinivirgaceae bacterium]
MKSKCNVLCTHLVLLFYVLLISYLSLMPVSDMQSKWILFAHADKIVHFGFYFLFAILVFRALLAINKTSPGILVLLSFLIPVVYGGAIELAQEYLVTDRSAEFLDFFANVLGASLGAYLYRLFFRSQLAVICSEA